MKKELISFFCIALLLINSVGCANTSSESSSVPVQSESSGTSAPEESTAATSDTESSAPDETQKSEATTSAPQTTASSTAETTAATTALTSAATSSTTETTTASTTQTTASSAQTTVTTTKATTTAKPVEIPPSEDLSDLMLQYYEETAEREEDFADIAKKKTMPAVYITTYDNERILSKDYYVDAVIDVVNCDEEYRLTAEGGVKVRGNSTANDSEKPYRIKFDKKQGMLGLHDDMKFKSWVLLRSQWNLVPDCMGFALAETIFDGEYYSSDYTYVNVYINGRGVGLYLLCEQNQAVEGRVEVYEPKEDELQTDIGYFLEMDNYANEDEAPFFTLDYDGIEFTDYVGTTKAFVPDDFSIKSDITCDEQRQFIAKYLDGVFHIMYEAVENDKPMMFDKDYNVLSAEGVYPTAKEAVEAVIDLDSMVNTMILQELVHNYDVGAGSFFMAVDFSEESKYERLTFLAPWDFNWAYSEETHGRYYAGAFQKPVHDMYERSNVWLTVIMKADWFRDMLKEKWKELDNGTALAKTAANVFKIAQSLENDLGDESWRIDSAKGVVSFVRGRIQWLKGEWE